MASVLANGVARGVATGCDFPADEAALAHGGAAMLTRAFHAFGSLPPDNAVTGIARIVECPGGSTGKKLFLSVRYARPDPALHTDLFAKFSRNRDDAYLDARGQQEMLGEIRFAGLARATTPAVAVPRPYFADTAADGSAGLLITERIAFGNGVIEPQHPKCLDQALDDPPAYYRAIIRALASVAAAHRSGRLGADIDALFPRDRDGQIAEHRLRYDAAQIRRHVGEYAAFVARCPQLFPATFTPAFFAGIAASAARLVSAQERINAFLQDDSDLIALCHWNAHIDNAYFWRDGTGRPTCGLMDWGRTSQMNLAFALWGCLSGAGLSIWNDHLDDLLELFVTVLHAEGGPRIDAAVLGHHLELHVAMMGLSHFIDSAPRMLALWPGIVDACGPDDPRLLEQERARCQLGITTAFLNFWQTRAIGRTLQGAD